MQFLVPYFRVVSAVLAIGLAAACSATRPYANSAPNNGTIAADIQTGSARLHVYEASGTCQLSYQGTVELGKQDVNIGLLVNKASYLVFEFSSLSPFTGRSSVSYDLYLVPRAGYHYALAISYADRMYGATIHEQDRRTGARREMARSVPTACTSK